MVGVYMLGRYSDRALYGACRRRDDDSIAIGGGNSPLPFFFQSCCFTYLEAYSSASPPKVCASEGVQNQIVKYFAEISTVPDFCDGQVCASLMDVQKDLSNIYELLVKVPTFLFHRRKHWSLEILKVYLLLHQPISNPNVVYLKPLYMASCLLNLPTSNRIL
ncbi:Uncharacterized protein Rs2_09498 [Raphanus sativus]|nr:Uncharacterized protein Rs2_09498 [Raphanus sativus]